MKLTKEQESEIIQVYKTYFDSYANGDTNTLASLIDDHYIQIGSAESEVFFNKEEAMQFVYDTIDQVAGKAEMRNRVIKLEPLQNYVLVSEFFDMYVLNEGEWTYYSKFRASSLLQNKNGQWIFIHQHSSIPDMRTQEGENIAIEKITKENLELRDAVKRRTVELEQKNHELTLEAALERVRTAAMSMRKPDELPGICEILFKELQQMGFSELRNAMINIHDDDHASFVNYDYSDAMGKSINHLKYNIHPVIAKQIKEIRSKGDAFSETVFSGKDLADWKAFRKEIGEKDDPRIDKIDVLFYYFYSIGTGSIGISTFTAIGEEKLGILKRFRNVFDFAYRRYLDVAQAEAQAREAQIQLALERVRARTMAMQHSYELKDAASLLFQQVKELGIDAWTCGYAIWEEDRKTVKAWLSRGMMQPPFKIPLTENQTLNHFYEAAQRGDSLFVEEIGGETIIELYKYLGTLMVSEGVSEEIRQTGFAAPSAQVNHAAFFSFGYLLFVTYKPYPEAHEIFKRFAVVFEQTYTRFLDIEKAEIQAREANIESALERVRSKTMAMHNSNDVGDTVTTMFDEFLKLGISTNRCGILIFGDTPLTEVWTAKNNPDGKANLIIGNLDLMIHPLLQNVYEAWKGKKSFFQYDLFGEDIMNYYQAINNARDYPVRFNPESIPSKEAHSDFFFNDGAVFAFTKEPIPDESSGILMRFAGVFGQTYRRYLDLQKAEAQAREATIEAALERVRFQAMAMQNSEDVGIATATMFTELDKLGVENLRCGIAIINIDQTMEVWSAATTETGKTIKNVGFFDMNAHPLWQDFFKKWSQKEEAFYYYLTGEEKKAYYKILSSTPGYILTHELHELPDQHFQSYSFPEGAIWSFSIKPHSEAENQVLQRFTAVFALTFRRYQDLKKAEAQAREATIEAALEKVRGSAMAMHNSNDLTSTASMVFTELRKLGINPIRCGVGLLNKENRKILLYSATTSDEGDHLLLAGWAILNDHPVLSEIYNAWRRSEDFFPVLKGDQLKTYYQMIKSRFAVPDANPHYAQYGYFLAFSEGTFYCWLENPLSEVELKILKRFKVIIDLTFRRYMELQKSEQNALEAVRRASLDRVRAEIASMRTVSDLERITPLIWNELKTLGVPFVRCGIFIMDEDQNIIHTFLTTPEGKAIASFHLPFDVSPDIIQVVQHWRKKQHYQQHWDEAAFMEWTGKLTEVGALPVSSTYATENRPQNLYLNFLPFLQGMLYVGNDSPMEEADLQIGQSLSDAFSTAYARYEDFRKLENAKVQVDKTLADLKQTQVQLVQAEKMASLGELTAGIAHEIQNPLNFVNNFSDINTELSEEIIEAVDRGDLEEIRHLASDIKTNQNRISEHGRRADAIVKGMLQHSRTSSGTKEPVDINKLADEYFRLSYHGLRAKDKSFNATLQTEFYPAIGEIPIIPQEIGRVLLNLYNNAFYAVVEKKKKLADMYDPIVSVRTYEEEDKVCISVADNGMGIPEKIKEKIFQPFFTTKPTGEGTGLGLSLSYDIVKAHNGDLVCVSTEGKGSEFIIRLPV